MFMLCFPIFRCLNIPKHQNASKGNRCRLKVIQNSREWDIDIDCPFRHVQENNPWSPPSLYELAKRVLYQIISGTATKLSSNTNYTNLYSYSNNNNFKCMNDRLGSQFQGLNMNSCDLNGNTFTTIKNTEISKKIVKKNFYDPADIVKEYFDILPSFIKKDLYNGPISKCENALCKKPVFDYVINEYCLG